MSRESRNQVEENKFVAELQLTKPHFNLSPCLFGPTRENHPLQFETSWTAADEPRPRWTARSLARSLALSISSLFCAVFRSVCVGETTVHPVNALSIAGATVNKTAGYFLPQGWIAAPRGEENPHWKVKKKKKTDWILRGRHSVCLNTQLSITAGVTFRRDTSTPVLSRKI